MSKAKSALVSEKEFYQAKGMYRQAVLAFLSEDGETCGIYEEDYLLVCILFAVNGRRDDWSQPMLGLFDTESTIEIFNELCHRTNVPCLILHKMGGVWDIDECFSGR